MFDTGTQPLGISVPRAPSSATSLGALGGGDAASQSAAGKRKRTPTITTTPTTPAVVSTLAMGKRTTLVIEDSEDDVVEVPQPAKKKVKSTPQPVSPSYSARGRTATPGRAVSMRADIALVPGKAATTSFKTLNAADTDSSEPMDVDQLDREISKKTTGKEIKEKQTWNQVVPQGEMCYGRQTERKNMVRFVHSSSRHRKLKTPPVRQVPRPRLGRVLHVLAAGYVPDLPLARERLHRRDPSVQGSSVCLERD